MLSPCCSHKLIKHDSTRLFMRAVTFQNNCFVVSGKNRDCPIGFTKVTNVVKVDAGKTARGLNTNKVCAGYPWRDVSEAELKEALGAPNSFLIPQAMHLTQSQVKKLLPALTKFAETETFD